jgi:hypothetical protein
MARAPRTCLVPLVLAALVGLVGAAPALGSAKDVIRDCSEDGVLNGHYSHGELAKALDKLPSDLDEYTDCRAVIRSAELRSAKKQNSGPAGATAAPPTPDEQRKIDDAARSAGPVKVGGKTIRPGASGAAFKAAGLGTDLPPLVLAVLVAIAGATLAAGTLAARRGGLTTALRDGISRFRR